MVLPFFKSAHQSFMFIILTISVREGHREDFLKSLLLQNDFFCLLNLANIICGAQRTLLNF